MRDAFALMTPEQEQSRLKRSRGRPGPRYPAQPRVTHVKNGDGLRAFNDRHD